MVIGGIQKFSTVDDPGYVVTGVFTVGCNMRCGYCHNPELVLPEQYAGGIPEEEFFEFLESRRGKLDGVFISGGEPTMHDDLPDFIRRCKTMGFRVKLDTNGTNPQRVRELLNEDLVDFIAMDVKGPLNKYSQIAARPVNLAAIQESVDLIKTIDHEFRTTIVKGQLEVEDFHDVGKLVKGARRFALQFFVTGPRLVSPQFRDRVSFSPDEMNQAKRIMLQYVQECVVH